MTMNMTQRRYAIEKLNQLFHDRKHEIQRQGKAATDETKALRTAVENETVKFAQAAINKAIIKWLKTPRTYDDRYVLGKYIVDECAKPTLKKFAKAKELAQLRAKTKIDKLSDKLADMENRIMLGDSEEALAVLKEFRDFKV